jgi:hypothetical protein
MRISNLIAALVLALLPAVALSTPTVGSKAATASSDELPDPFEVESLAQKVKAIGRLSSKAELVFWDDLQASLAATGALQVSLVNALIGDSLIDRENLPLATDFGAHNAKLYPPGSTRKTVRKGSSSWKKLDKEMVTIDAGRDLPTFYTYDFGTGEVVLLDPEVKDMKRGLLALEYALAGFPVDQDLAEAILLARLDAPRKFAKQDNFFAHDYADLKSKAYDGISLYRVWSHQIPLDVPTIDLRAYAMLVHSEELPVKVNQKLKNQWYPRMSSSLFDSRGHRQAAIATAAHYFQAAPKVPGGWGASANVMHAFCAYLGLGPEAGTSGLVSAFHDKGASIATAALPIIQDGGNEAWNKGNARKEGLLIGRMKIREAAIAAMDRALKK